MAVRFLFESQTERLIPLLYLSIKRVLVMEVVFFKEQNQCSIIRHTVSFNSIYSSSLSESACALTTLQLHRRQFSQRFRCVMLVAANVPASLKRRWSGKLTSFQLNNPTFSTPVNRL